MPADAFLDVKAGIGDSRLIEISKRDQSVTIFTSLRIFQEYSTHLLVACTRCDLQLEDIAVATP